jgi:hypothetical protein
LPDYDDKELLRSKLLMALHSLDEAFTLYWNGATARVCHRWYRSTCLLSWIACFPKSCVRTTRLGCLQYRSQKAHSVSGPLFVYYPTLLFDGAIMTT